VAATGAEADALRAKAAAWREDGVAVEPLAAADLARLEPALAGGLEHALHLPGEAQVRNARHLRALLEGCRRRGVEILAGRAAIALVRRADRVEAVATADGAVAGERFVVAAGAWSPALLASAGLDLPGRPVRGQLVLLDAGVPRLGRIVWQGPRYLVPRPDGRVLVGSTEEDAGFDHQPTAGGVAGLLGLATRLLPALAAASFGGAWAGLRPGSPDGLPTLGAADGLANLYLATGHHRAGFELSAGTARVVADLLLGRPPAVPLDAFRFGRHAAAPSGAHAEVGPPDPPARVEA
jgi:glycine oxidase